MPPDRIGYELFEKAQEVKLDDPNFEEIVYKLANSWTPMRATLSGTVDNKDEQVKAIANALGGASGVYRRDFEIGMDSVVPNPAYTREDGTVELYIKTGGQSEPSKFGFRTSI